MFKMESDTYVIMTYCFTSLHHDATSEIFQTRYIRRVYYKGEVLTLFLINLDHWFYASLSIDAEKKNK
jgi:hypothetical protein